VAEFVRFFFSIGGLMAVLAVGFVWLFARPKQLAPARFIVAVIVAFAIASMYPVSRAVASLLSSGYHPLEKNSVPPGRTAIVMLGIGQLHFTRLGRQSRVDHGVPLARIARIETARLYRLLDPEWIISSGGAVGSMDPERTRRQGHGRCSYPAGRPFVPHLARARLADNPR